MDYQFEFSYKCKCNAKTHFLYPHKQKTSIIPDMTDHICIFCGEKITITKTKRSDIKNDKIISTVEV